MIITNGKIITPKEILADHSLLIRDGKIARIAHAHTALSAPDEPTLDAQGGYVAPGFIDIHCHSAMGCDTMDAHLESIAKIVRFHATGGTTAIVPTTVTASPEKIMKAIEIVAEARGHDFGGAQVLGIHLEGPYIAAAKAGAQDPQQIRPPNPDEYAAWLEHDDVITQVTVAPEVDGALEFIEKLTEHEIIASGGHSDATEDVVQAAIARGLCHGTHLFNCMSTVTKRGAFRVAGMAEALLADDGVTVELVADGKHLPAASMRLAVKAKGVDRVCLITDATAGAGLPAGTEFNVGDVRAVVGDGVAMTADGKALAGSTAQMIALVKTVASLGFTLVDAVRMASLTPARVLGISGCKGSLEERKDADIVIFDDNFTVRQTIVGGNTVFQAQN
jgi:N-acetylglucosamine-6-phosphate deacetylase